MCIYIFKSMCRKAEIVYLKRDRRVQAVKPDFLGLCLDCLLSFMTVGRLIFLGCFLSWKTVIIAPLRRKVVRTQALTSVKLSEQSLCQCSVEEEEEDEERALVSFLPYTAVQQI